MRTIIIILLVTLNVGASAQSWTNPLTLNDEWPQYGIGDPYILKHRGVYYLYCSTKDNSTGVKCWSTKDFVTWSGPYNCTGEAITKTAYAPEVVYWNGTFYMYTSPGGNGHYVLSSNSPTGPFTRITENLGKSIDGSIFIDDNGAWYFYHAAEAGIQGCRMSSPTTIEQDVDLNARMGNGWTEGPTVVKRGGVYYLIYTGNHVISKGYRIDYAQNTTGPISAYTPQSRQNPILINTEGAFVGLGHGSAFIGPDLDTYYYTYHNLESGSGPRRHLNFDRMAWNGTKLLLLGPTNWPQEPFRMADMCDFFDRDQAGENLLFPNGGDWRLNDRERLTQEHSAIDDTCLYKALLKPSTDDDYTAEFTFKYLPGKSDDARFGAVFGYTDEANYGIALWNCRTNRLEINFMTSAHWETPRYANLPSGYRPEVWHHLRIEKAGTSHRFFVDGQQKAAIEKVTGGGKIGYATSRCQADFAYIAFSNQVNGSAIGNTYKPLPGSIAAVHCNTEGIGREKATTVDAGTEGGYAIVARGDERYSYKINPKAAGRYHLALRYSANEASRIRIRQGEREVTGVVALPMTANRGTNWQTLTVKNLTLTDGYQTIDVEIVDGNFKFYEMRFEEAGSATIARSDAFDTSFHPDWNYTDGAWSIRSGEAVIDGTGKRTMGDAGWADYEVQVDVTCLRAFNAGLIFRVKNPALGGAGNDPVLGTDFLQAYFVSLSENAVVLGKHNYNYTTLATQAASCVLNRKYTLKVALKGANIKVYVDDMETPRIDYTDAHPLICGKAGLRANNTEARFDNFILRGAQDENPSKTNVPDKDTALNVFPNPVADELTVLHPAAFSALCIYRADGREVYRENLAATSTVINTSRLDRGLYLLQLRNDAGDAITRKFVK